MGRSINSTIKGNGVYAPTYNEPDFSTESIIRFAKKTGKYGGKGVFAEAIRNNPTARRYRLQSHADEIVENIGNGPIRVNNVEESVMIKAGERLRDIIQKNFFEAQKNDFMYVPHGNIPNVYIEPREKDPTLYIEYNSEYLYRPSLQTAWGDNAGRRRIRRNGLRDIYQYFVNGVESNPKKVFGYWATVDGERLVPKPVAGNINLMHGTDFVVISISEFFNDPWVKQIPSIQVLIPSKWSKNGTKYFSNNNTGALRGDFGG